MKTGIYKIISAVDNKVYIGQSVHIPTRMADHFKCLRNGKHSNRHLQFAYNKYGRINFRYEILCLCSRELLNQKERDCIIKYKSLDDLLNIC